MDWKKILKMPVPIGTRENRDEAHKQAIIEFEKTVIEPELTKKIQSMPSEENRTMLIGFNKDIDDKSGFSDRGNVYYAIGSNERKRLGDNMDYIIKVIGEIYQSEGYSVESGSTNLAGMPTAIINQSSTTAHR